MPIDEERVMKIIQRSGPYRDMTDLQAGLEAGRAMGGLPKCQEIEVIVRTDEKNPRKNEG